MLTLKEKDIQELNNMLQELPVKYGVPIINLLNKVATEAAKEKEAADAAAEDKS